MDGKLSNYDIECAISLGLATPNNVQNSSYNKYISVHSKKYAMEKTEEILKNICNNVEPKYRMFYDVETYNFLRRKMMNFNRIFNIMEIILYTLFSVFSIISTLNGLGSHLPSIINDPEMRTKRMFYIFLAFVAMGLAFLTTNMHKKYNQKYIDQMNPIVKNAHNYIEYNFKLFSQQDVDYQQF